MTSDEQKRFEEALAFATKKHEGQFRVGGLPYISHPIAVAEIVAEQASDIDVRIAALFHDLLEDTDASEEKILAFGGEKVLKAVKLLTKRKGYVMEEYVAGIRRDPIAFAVKGADRLHNLRSALCTKDDFKRKYILETVDWYLGFHPEIPAAVKRLAESLEEPLTELPFLYKPVENWKITE